MPVSYFHGLRDLLIAVGKEKRLGGGTSEQDVVDGQKVRRFHHQLGNGLRLFVEDPGGHLRANI
jgi:hypothetical protein